NFTDYWRTAGNDYRIVAKETFEAFIEKRAKAGQFLTLGGMKSYTSIRNRFMYLLRTRDLFHRIKWIRVRISHKSFRIEYVRLVVRITSINDNCTSLHTQ
ncbi:unnamed protein product, partial [Angiostrongylus costaricensis]|uniref:Inhibitor_I29 domain-containing protein n=1 Tax=Angiostrongylus costaricensis TaxID=334426 RepID=A0A0R3PSB3_ANGCS